MGTYIQIGVCIEVRLDKAAAVSAKITLDEAVRRIGELYDLSIFDREDTDEQVSWILPPKLLEEGLVPFLRAQYGLFGEGRTKDTEDVLTRIASAGSRDAIVALAKGKSSPWFQHNTIRDYASLASPGYRPRVETDILIYLVEGKAIMETYRGLFDYVEGLIHRQKDEMPIAAAVKVFLE